MTPKSTPKTIEKLSIMEQLQVYTNVLDLNIDWLRPHFIANGFISEKASNDTVLGITHRVRMKLISASEAQKRDSEIYLRLHNML